MGILLYLRQVVWTAGYVMHYITIPGSFFHELAHQLACYLVGHKVLEVRYMVRDDPTLAGYVLHQGPPGVGRHLLIGIAPLIMGFFIWAVTLGLGWYFLHDGRIAIWQAVLLLAMAWATAAATYHAVPSPLDMENVFKQPFSLLTIPCYAIAGPVWLFAHTYKFHLWGWTVWRILVVIGTIYVIYLMINPNLSQFSGAPNLAGRIVGALYGLVGVFAR